MENLVSSWSNNGGSSLPETYVFPPEKRPGELTVPLSNSIPIIDLQIEDQTNIVQQILNASQDFGFFQVVNHGISKELMDETMRLIKEFHAMPAEEKARECSRDPNRSCKIYTSSENYATEQVHYWRDAVVHPCEPLEHCKQFWPLQPPGYRDVVASYVVEVRKLAYEILSLICEGLGLSAEYLSVRELSGKPMLMVNHYPKCPEPSLTLGLAKHQDPSLITIVFQGDVAGLQVFKDEQWISVEPIPHALIVNVGFLLQIISNGKLKGAEHRVVTNSGIGRTTASYFIYPMEESVIEPAKAFLDEKNPALYRALKFKEFRDKYVTAGADAQALLHFLTPKQD